MRARRMFAECDDRLECHALRSHPDRQAFDLPCEPRLLDARFEHVRNFFQDPPRNGACGADSRQFLRRLGPAEFFDDAFGRLEPHVRKHPGPELQLRDGDVAGLESAYAQRAKVCSEFLGRTDGANRRQPCAFDVEIVGIQQDPARNDQNISARHRHARQIADVGQIGDQKRGCFGLAENGSRRWEFIGHIFARKNTPEMASRWSQSASK